MINQNQSPDDDDWDEPFYSNDDDSDPDFDSTSDLIACPNCNSQIHEESVRCPICGNYITADQTIWRNKPKWFRQLGWILLVLAAIGLLLGALPNLF
jgi:DNA-directed RNA polymerase subunit RPC12/RpoP